MFTVGEFSRLAQVSKRLLRYYDEIGLLKPVRIDHFTGYRYYSAEQLPDLNRIRALKDLGLSLDQIQQMLRNNVSTGEMQGMLLLKKAELEQQLEEEAQRIRNIEARLQSIRDAGTARLLDVVIKQIPAQPALSIRTAIESLESGLAVFEQIRTALPDTSAYGSFFAILHSDGFDEVEMDVQLGRIIKVKNNAPVPLHGDLQLHVCELPAVPTMATYVVKGSKESMLTGYNAIGMWAEANGYDFAGPPREIALQMPQAADGSDGITEIQFPVEAVHQT